MLQSLVLNNLTLYFLIHFDKYYLLLLGFPGGSVSKESACNVGDLRLIPGLGRSPGGGHGNPLQRFAWRSPMDRGAWRDTVHGVAESDMTE